MGCSVEIPPEFIARVQARLDEFEEPERGEILALMRAWRKHCRSAKSHRVGLLWEITWFTWSRKISVLAATKIVLKRLAEGRIQTVGPLPPNWHQRQLSSREHLKEALTWRPS
jgi:hypothetical protein